MPKRVQSATVKVISVQQPWAQLIADRRRHVIIKGWSLDPGEQVAIRASHVLNEEKCREFGYDYTKIPLRAIVAVAEVRKCIPRKDARASKFDVHGPSQREEKQYAIVVRTLHKLREPIPASTHVSQRTWDCPSIGKALARTPQDTKTTESSI